MKTDVSKAMNSYHGFRNQTRILNPLSFLEVRNRIS